MDGCVEATATPDRDGRLAEPVRDKLGDPTPLKARFERSCFTRDRYAAADFSAGDYL